MVGTLPALLVESPAMEDPKMGCFLWILVSVLVTAVEGPSDAPKSAMVDLTLGFAVRGIWESALLRIICSCLADAAPLCLQPGLTTFG